MSGVPQLNRRLTLEAPAAIDDGAGGYEPVWTVLGVLWAQVAPRGGAERRGHNRPGSRTRYKITVRAAPVGALDRPRPEQRFRDGQRVFEITAVTEMDAQGLYLTCHAEEEVMA